MDRLTGFDFPDDSHQALTLNAARGRQALTLEEAVRGPGGEAWFPKPQTTPVQRPPTVLDQRLASIAELPEFLTARQVAGLLDINEKSVMRWSHADPSM